MADCARLISSLTAVLAVAAVAAHAGMVWIDGTKTDETAAARNETKCAALALTTTSTGNTFTTEVTVAEFRKAGGGAARGIRGNLYAVGAIASAVYGVCLSPLFEQGDMPGESMMRRYVTDADVIKDFPRLSLPPTR